ncbi:TetR/AcrR family transcriptional regulator [Streptosporangium sp. NPDC002524]|uniref:TetR/AcrR family transcriptional regulator n=1 Tax=Streptosporangium sp. NPDC002524 TaxID=3154537 RepID=UPI00331D72F2
MTPNAERAPALRADAARNRARVLQVAREQLATGDDSLMLNTIARLTGVGVGMVYRHFPNRHALLEALSAERFQQLVHEAQAAGQSRIVNVTSGSVRAAKRSFGAVEPFRCSSTPAPPREGLRPPTSRRPPARSRR